MPVGTVVFVVIALVLAGIIQVVTDPRRKLRSPSDDRRLDLSRAAVSVVAGVVVALVVLFAVLRMVRGVV